MALWDGVDLIATIFWSGMVRHIFLEIQAPDRIGVSTIETPDRIGVSAIETPILSNLKNLYLDYCRNEAIYRIQITVL